MRYVRTIFIIHLVLCTYTYYYFLLQYIGMFRLAKVNCDNERSIAQALDVSSLPSVFAVKDAKVTDK